MGDEARLLVKLDRLFARATPEVQRWAAEYVVKKYGNPRAVVRAYERDRKAARRSRTEVPDTGGDCVPDEMGPFVPDLANGSFGSFPVSLAFKSYDHRLLRQQALEVLARLNAYTGKRFRAVDVNLELIEARLKSGVAVTDCCDVIALKTREWKGTDQEKYLRPETLFGRKKFEQYLGEIGAEPAPTPDLAQPIAWGQPGSLMWLYNAKAPDEWTAVDTPSRGLLEAERRQLAERPERTWWEATFAQLGLSRFLRRELKTRDFAWLMAIDDHGIERAVLIHDGRYRDGG